MGGIQICPQGEPKLVFIPGGVKANGGTIRKANKWGGGQSVTKKSFSLSNQCFKIFEALIFKIFLWGALSLGLLSL